MKTFQTHTTFYVELAPSEITIFPKHGAVTVYPIWLGKNRAVMRDAITAFKKTPPQTFVEAIELASRLNLVGMNSYAKKIDELFVEDKKSLDTPKVFW